MASIDGINLGGNGSAANTAVACNLRRPLAKDLSFIGINDGWSVIGNSGKSTLIATNEKIMGAPEAKQAGITALMEALDLVCVAHNINNNLANATEQCTLFLTENGQSIVEMELTADWKISVQMDIRTQNGNNLRAPQDQQPRWHKSLRYYRLSQISSDIYEAYRNLYLAFESLAETLLPRTKVEREGAWIRRVFMQLAANGSLSEFAPDGHRYPGEYLFGILYEKTRCNLFHSRTPEAFTPYYSIDISKVTRAYDTLLGVWRKIAGATLGFFNGGAVVTYGGYKRMLENALTNVPLQVQVTTDDTPPEHADTATSPKGLAVLELSRCDFGGEVSPGLILGFSAMESDPKRFPEINRIGLLANSILHGVCHIKKLVLDDIDTFKVRAMFRLEQPDLPRTRF